MRARARIGFADVVAALMVTNGPHPDKSVPPLCPFGALDLRSVLDGTGVGQIALGRFKYVAQPVALDILALSTNDAQGDFYEPVGRVNVVLPQHQLEPGNVFAKTYGENEPLREPLLRSGLLRDTGGRIQEWVAEIEVWELTLEFYAQCEAANRTTFARLRERQYIAA